MEKLIKINKTEQCTVYTAREGVKLRIVQTGDNKFIIERLSKKSKTKGCLWWKKTSVIDEWERVDVFGRPYFMIFTRVSNIDILTTFENFEKAFKWINDYHKYPIYL